ncbi:hypothetical protein [Kingella potus]|nr:hypothetical protein [Kingella potus]UOP00088.1 hypothetical protein LVJ84_08920 [Kingella potus]
MASERRTHPIPRRRVCRLSDARVLCYADTEALKTCKQVFRRPVHAASQ